MTIIGIASLMLCHLLYKTRLIPRPISIVGIIGYALVLLSAILDLMVIIGTTGIAGILYIPSALEEMMAMKPNQGLLLVFSILLEIPIAMIVLSRLLRYRVNRLANIIAGLITILWVIGGGNTSASYIFFSTIEVGCMLLIIRYAWKWSEGQK